MEGGLPSIAEDSLSIGGGGMKKQDHKVVLAESRIPSDQIDVLSFRLKVLIKVIIHIYLYMNKKLL
jgi:hypothetical protein